MADLYSQIKNGTTVYVLPEDTKKFGTKIIKCTVEHSSTHKDLPEDPMSAVNKRTFSANTFYVKVNGKNVQFECKKGQNSDWLMSTNPYIGGKAPDKYILALSPNILKKVGGVMEGKQMSRTDKVIALREGLIKEENFSDRGDVVKLYSQYGDKLKYLISNLAHNKDYSQFIDDLESDVDLFFDNDDTYDYAKRAKELDTLLKSLNDAYNSYINHLKQDYSGIEKTIKSFKSSLPKK